MSAFGSIVFEKSPRQTIRSPFQRNNDSIMAFILNHCCISEHTTGTPRARSHRECPLRSGSASDRWRGQSPSPDRTASGRHRPPTCTRPLCGAMAGEIPSRRWAGRKVILPRGVHKRKGMLSRAHRGLARRAKVPIGTRMALAVDIDDGGRRRSSRPGWATTVVRGQFHEKPASMGAGR